MIAMLLDQVCLRPKVTQDACQSALIVCLLTATAAWHVVAKMKSNECSLLL